LAESAMPPPPKKKLRKQTERIIYCQLLLHLGEGGGVVGERMLPSSSKYNQNKRNELRQKVGISSNSDTVYKGGTWPIGDIIQDR
jgi:hypothetical protein